jgi:phosphoglycolate phosphatase
MTGAPAARGDLVVGFDLDMTLVDSRVGIADVYRALSAETGVAIDADLATSRLGPPLATELAEWFEADDVPAMVDRFRQIYAKHAIGRTPLMPGAREAVDSVHHAGGRVIVITSKLEANARLHVEHCGLPVDGLVGSVYEDGKRDALLRYGAHWYVGDHASDMRSARAAARMAPELGLRAVGVTTGPCDEAALREAGADDVLSDLLGFDALFAPSASAGRESGWPRTNVSITSADA